MPLISYAQNMEDVMLWRAFKSVPRGFYIDVGASEPTANSVTKVFYDSGWHGINIEPVERCFRALEEHRVRDINLKIAVAAYEGETVLYDVDQTGLATCSAEEARRRADEGIPVVERAVQVRSLNTVWQEHVDGEVHFLKIDVEGWEREALLGLDLVSHRPWILVVEATEANSQRPSFATWEPMVIAAGYRFVYFDGLNRFYVSPDHPELTEAFSSPPNYFDHFVRYQEHSAVVSAKAAAVWAKDMEAQLKEHHERDVAPSQWCWELEGSVQRQGGDLERLRRQHHEVEERLAMETTQRVETERNLSRVEAELLALRQQVALAEATIAQKEQECVEVGKELLGLQGELAGTEQQLLLLQQELGSITGGLIWRLSTPLRTASRPLRRWALGLRPSADTDQSGSSPLQRSNGQAMEEAAVAKSAFFGGAPGGVNGPGTKPRLTMRILSAGRRQLIRHPRMRRWVNDRLDSQPILKQRLLSMAPLVPSSGPRPLDETVGDRGAGGGAGIEGAPASGRARYSAQTLRVYDQIVAARAAAAQQAGTKAAP